MARNLVSTIGAQASPTMGDGTRCPEGQAFPAGKIVADGWVIDSNLK